MRGLLFACPLLARLIELQGTILKDIQPLTQLRRLHRQISRRGFIAKWRNSRIRQRARCSSVSTLTTLPSMARWAFLVRTIISMRRLTGLNGSLRSNSADEAYPTTRATRSSG